jgi:hypothetical protein
LVVLENLKRRIVRSQQWKDKKGLFLFKRGPFVFHCQNRRRLSVQTLGQQKKIAKEPLHKKTAKK